MDSKWDINFLLLYSNYRMNYEKGIVTDIL